MRTLSVRFDTRGQAMAIYDDALLDVVDALGTSATRRASCVEPANGGGWTVDLTPSSGPACLGIFRKRADALAAEVMWLRTHYCAA